MSQVYPDQEMKKQLENLAWHMRQGNPPQLFPPASFSMLLNLNSLCHVPDRYTLWPLFLGKLRAWVLKPIPK